MADIQVKLDADKLEAIAKGLAVTCRNTWPEVRGARGVSGMLALIPKVVGLVEKTGKDVGMVGSDKKELAVQIICDLVPDAWVPDWVLAPILGWAIEKAVAALKSKLAGLRR